MESPSINSLARGQREQMELSWSSSRVYLVSEKFKENFHSERRLCWPKSSSQVFLNVQSLLAAWRANNL